MDQGNGRKSKLRWHCGLCNVSCKDANGFRCHLQCESHLTREEAGHVRARYRIDDGSRQFAKRFMDLLLKEFFEQRVLAHDVYETMCPNDRPHAVMKNTCWQTLGTFVVYLRDRDRVEAEKTETGWKLFVGLDHLGAEELTALEQFPSEIDGPPPIAWNGVKRRPSPPAPRPKKAACVVGQPKDTTDHMSPDHSLNRAGNTARIVFAVAKPLSAKPTLCGLVPPPDPPHRSTSGANAQPSNPMPLTANSKHARAWPRVGMVVKIVAGGLHQPSWHNRKCVVLEAGPSMVEVMACASSDKRLVRASHLETVIPRLGGRVQLCGGEHEGRFGVLHELRTSEFCGSVLLDSMLEPVSVPYEWFSKVQQPEC